MNVSFDNFIGNSAVKAALTAAFLQNRVPQAIILQGDKGVGKKTFAKIIANIAVCQSENKACGVCPACIRAKAGSHPDIRIEEGSGVSGNISVDSIRSIISDAQKKPDEAEYNIFLLFIKNTLSQASQNKLLKIMEEPPGKAIFIIAINSAESLLPTIRSRATSFSLSAPSIEESAEFFSLKNSVDYNESFELATLYGGNLGAMAQGNSEPVRVAIRTSEIIDGNDENEVLAISTPLAKNRETFSLYLENMRNIYRDAVIMSHGVKSSLGVSPLQSERLSRTYRKAQLIQLPDLCTDFLEYTKRNVNMNLIVTVFCSLQRRIFNK
ncbi:MAG: hypothetical protein R3Y33_00925 [Clostridia bacterium]